MSPDPSESARPLTPGQFWSRLAVVALIVSSVAVLFLFTAGWFSRSALTPERMVDTFEHVNGPHPGFRRNHAKGLGVRGHFESNGRGTRFSKASVFQPGNVPVVGRFALAGGMPAVADSVKAVRSLALEFTLQNGEQWRTGMNSIPVFPVRTPEAFREQLIAMAPDPVTKKPNPARVAPFLEKYPETARALRRIQSEKPAAGFADSTFNGLNAFVLTNTAGKTTNVRFALVPEAPAEAEAAAAKEGGKNFLFEALVARIRRAPLRFHLMLTIGAETDPTNDATSEWPPEREKVDVGTLVIDHAESEATSPARNINFDPLVLPAGIAGSDDPLLSARSAAYAVSFRRRLGEPVSASAVDFPEVGK